jgi:hypothetical protein
MNRWTSLEGLWMERFDYLNPFPSLGMSFPPLRDIVRDASGSISDEASSRGVEKIECLPSLRRSVSEMITAIEREYHRNDVSRSTDSIRREVVSAADRVLAVAEWSKSGKLVYVVDALTIAAFDWTDLPAVPFGDLPIPFEIFYLHLCAPIQLDGGTLEGIFVDFRASKQQFLRWKLVGEDYSGNPLSAVLSFQWKGSCTLEDVLDTALGEGGGRHFTPDTPPEVRPVAVRVFQIVTNLCLYIASSHADLRPVPPSTRSPTGFSGETLPKSSLQYTYVGASSPLRDYVPPDGPGARDERIERGALEHEVHVRGHWRWQAHGPEWAERKLVWIAPHRRGPDQQAEVPRVHRVQPAEQSQNERTTSTTPRWG